MISMNAGTIGMSQAVLLLMSDNLINSFIAFAFILPSISTRVAAHNCATVRLDSTLLSVTNHLSLLIGP
jgi:hypothetical protein